MSMKDSCRMSLSITFPVLSLKSGMSPVTPPSAVSTVSLTRASLYALQGQTVMALAEASSSMDMMVGVMSRRLSVGFSQWSLLVSVTVEEE